MPFNIDPQSDVALISIFIADFAIYWIFCRIGTMANTMRNQEVIAPRLLGCIGIIVLTILIAWFIRENFVDAAKYGAMSAREQGEYLGGLLRVAVFPAIIIIGISAARGWRDAQERKYRGKHT